MQPASSRITQLAAEQGHMNLNQIRLLHIKYLQLNNLFRCTICLQLKKQDNCINNDTKADELSLSHYINI
jgi:hypothetical protein